MADKSYGKCKQFERIEGDSGKCKAENGTIVGCGGETYLCYIEEPESQY